MSAKKRGEGIYKCGDQKNRSLHQVPRPSSTLQSMQGCPTSEGCNRGLCVIWSIQFGMGVNGARPQITSATLRRAVPAKLPYANRVLFFRPFQSSSQLRRLPSVAETSTLGTGKDCRVEQSNRSADMQTRLSRQAKMPCGFFATQKTPQALLRSLEP